MGIARYLSKLASGLNSEGVVSASKGGTGSSSGGGGGGNNLPTVTGIIYSGNDTAVNTSGGDTVTLTGTNFNTGVNVVVNGISASVVTRVSSTQLTFIAPAQPTGNYIVYVINTDGTTGLAVPGIQYSPTPSWTTSAGSLGITVKNLSFTTTLASTGDAPVTYSVISGTLPSGISLNSSTGVLSGTTPDVVSSTTYNFTVRATDAQLQDTDRAFSLTILPGNPPPTVEYLVVAGGGGGGYYGGGGGAGGLLTGTSSVAPATIYTVTVGGGGLGGLSSGTLGTQGGDSTFNGIVTKGGGRGGQGAASQGGGNGGSGGGGASGDETNQAQPAGKGVYPGSVYLSQARQGYDGGIGQAGNNDYAAGGGGAGATGSNGTAGGTGGTGLQSSISGTAIYYAGGGGGGGWYGAGGGGAGGGGSAISSGAGNPGTTNTGGGGGGCRHVTQGGTAGGAGGSGIVVIRYADTYDAAPATTGSPVYTVSGGYRVYKFNSSGSIAF